jgi:nucleoside-diphosphate-sugar epimerase
MTLCTVLGASGYIGRHMVDYLRKQGHSVWAPARGDESVFSRDLGHLFYCVGLTGNFRARPFDTVQAHVGYLSEVLRRGQFASLLYLSSTRVYVDAQVTHEDSPLAVQSQDPSYLYNLSKLMGEALCHSCGRPQVRVARLSNVVGPGLDPRSGNLVADLVCQARAGRIVLRTAPQSAKDYVHIDDVVAWLYRIALHGHYCTYNVASGVQTTHAEWLERLSTKFGASVEVLADSPLQSFPRIEVARLATEFGAEAKPIWAPDLF